MCPAVNQRSTTQELNFVQPAEAFRHIPKGARIFLGSGAAAPLALIDAMNRHRKYFVDHEVVSILTLGDAPHADPKLASHFRHNALFIGGNVRSAVESGAADYTPIFLSEIPDLFRSGKIAIGVAMIQIAPPRNGMCSLGVSVDVVKSAVMAADLIIAEVNPRMPFTYGDSCVPADAIDYFVRTDHDIPELPARQLTPEAKRIGMHVAKLVENGATIQAGIGMIPDAVLAALGNHRDLGVHTEMLSDGFVDLIESGAVSNLHKANHPGKSVASFALGTRKLYDFLRERTDVEFYPCDHVNDPYVIGQNPNMVAINTAIEVDLTGQVCSDSIGARFYSGIGGQVDFIRGAARSDGGKPIIAVTSTARNGTVSRIQPRLQRGGGVVTTRGDVHYIVTEWGIASLHGKTIRERATALIEIAHPKFRPWLLAEAKQHHYVYPDHLEAPIRLPVYPDELETFIEDRRGQRILLRPARISDEQLLHDMFYALSDESLYQRFFSATRQIPRSSVLDLCDCDYETTMTILAVVSGRAGERVIGAARYEMDPKTRLADAQFVVIDEFQGRGIGSQLVQRLEYIARERNIRGFTVDVLSANAAMLAAISKIKGKRTSSHHDNVESITIEFE